MASSTSTSHPHSHHPAAMHVKPPQLQVLTSPDWEDYTLLDSGNGLKLERYGHYILIRPEAEAIWKPALPAEAWAQAHARFQPSSDEGGGTWEVRHPLPERWPVCYKGLKCWVQRSTSRHIGLFPEQASQWDWIQERIRTTGRPISVLNLFGYTGLATLAAAQAGASVTHVDASRKAITWAHENQILSGLQDASIRWIVDDALKFTQREARRGRRYDGLILDPPKFGRGPKGEVWEFYKLLPELLQACRAVLSAEPVFVILTAYAVKASAITLYYALSETMSAWKGQIEVGEVALIETSGRRLLPTAIFARWFA
ncbi:MAG: class I SAM-dependent methyltransferase [Thermanaerothrix sp.]|nr:class I SAM-dependent methyltransferase [Thermanaerothrix sp.]